MQQCWVRITKPQGHLEKNDLANQKSWMMWRCHAENGGWWDELNLPMVVGDLTVTPEMWPLPHVFLSIGECSKEEAENASCSRGRPVRPLMVEAAVLPSVFESLSLPPPSNVRGVVERTSAQTVASTERARRRKRPVQRFRARQYGEKHRFVNLNEVLQHEAHQALFWGVEKVSDDLRQMFDPGEFS